MLARASLDEGARAVRHRLDGAETGAVELERPALDDLPYRDLVRALLTRQGFKLDFNRLDPDAAIALVCDRLLGPSSFRAERAPLARDIADLAAFAAGLVEGRAAISVRTCFAPGDTVWHVDRVQAPAAFRLLWPLGRPAGMRVTPGVNIDVAMFRMFHHREHPLLTRLDTQTLHSPTPVETLWAHRPAQLAAMISGRFPFIRDPDLEVEVTPGAGSIHRVQTPVNSGTYHRASWANRHAPGLQIVVTAS